MRINAPVALWKNMDVIVATIKRLYGPFYGNDSVTFLTFRKTSLPHIMKVLNLKKNAEMTRTLKGYTCFSDATDYSGSILAPCKQHVATETTEVSIDL